MIEFQVTIDNASPLAPLHARAAIAFVQPSSTAPLNEMISASQGHPILRCKELHFLHPALLRALVIDPRSGEIGNVWIPYSHILGILELPIDAPREQDVSENEAEGSVVSLSPAERKDALSTPRVH